MEGAIRSALGLLPGTRFAVGRVILPSAHVSAVLVAADTPDGRPLIPYVGYGPTNAAGVAQTAYGFVAIAGVETWPAWALPTADTIIGAGPSDATSFESSLLEFRFTERAGPNWRSSTFGELWRRGATAKGCHPRNLHRGGRGRRWHGPGRRRGLRLR